MDSVTKGQRNLLLFILGLAILVVPIRFIAAGNFEDRTSINNEKATQEARLSELRALDANRAQYIQDTETYKQEYEDILAKFPAELYQDNTLMYLQGVKDDYKFNFPSVSMGQETLFYTLGSGATGDVSVDGDAAAAGSGYNCYSASFPVTYEGSYKDIKDVMDYIKNGENRMTLDDISISYDEEGGTYSGSMTITAYAVSGEDRTTDHADVNVQIGTTNIFGGTSSRTTTSTTTSTSQTAE